MRKIRLQDAGRCVGFAAFPYALLTFSGVVTLDRELRLAGLGLFLSLLTLAAVPHRRRLLDAWKALGPIRPLWAAALISAAWSIEPGLTAWRGAVLSGTTAFGVFFFLYHGAAEQIRIVALTAAAGLLASLAAVWLFPSVGVMGGIHEGAWQGIFWHKNAFGRTAALGFAALLAQSFGSRRFGGLRLAGMALCLACALGSASAAGIVYLAALGAACLAIMALGAAPEGRARARRALALAPAGLVALLAAACLAEAALDALGRDVTLSGRTGLWQLALEKGFEKPWLGYGYGAFWGLGNEFTGVLSQRLGYNPGSAHNGFLDLFLALGTLGAALFLACLTRYAPPAAAGLMKPIGAQRAWPALFLLLYLLSSAVESLAFKADSAFWMLFVTCFCNLSDPGRELPRMP